MKRCERGSSRLVSAPSRVPFRTTQVFVWEILVDRPRGPVSDFEHNFRSKCLRFVYFCVLVLLIW